jgi:hypothetical protein
VAEGAVHLRRQTRTITAACKALPDTTNKNKNRGITSNREKEKRAELTGEKPVAQMVDAVSEELGGGGARGHAVTSRL